MSNKLVNVAIAAAIAAGVGAATTVQAAEKMEKCYGVAKAGQNDCATGGHACAGQSAADGAPAEWVYVPEGLCQKLVNGVLK